MFKKPIITNFSNKYGNNRWIVYSQKIQREVYLFSDLEYANWLLIENDSLVKYFCEQPILIKSQDDDGKIIKTIPDMYILYQNGVEEIREIKYEKDLETDRALRQSSEQKKWCMQNNMKHQIVTEITLLQNYVLLSNLKLLSKLDEIYNEEFSLEVKKYVSNIPKTLSQISREMNLEFDNVAEKLFFCIKEKQFNANIESLFLGPLTEVWKNEA